MTNSRTKKATKKITKRALIKIRRKNRKTTNSIMKRVPSTTTIMTMK